MSKVFTAPEQGVVIAAVPADVSLVVEVAMDAVAISEPVAVTLATKMPISKKSATTKVAAKETAPAKAEVKKTDSVAKPTAKTKAPVVAKPVAASAELSIPAKSASESRVKKPAPKKARLIRDSFTFPENDYALLATLKSRALGAGHEIKKSELLRAGLSALAALSDKDLLIVLNGVERIKTGRPAK